METKARDESTTATRLLDEAADADFIRALGMRVREGRARRGMSRKALALNADVSERYLAQVENGETNPSIMVLRHISDRIPVDSTLPRTALAESP